MVVWLIILGSACSGGLLVLHALNAWKSGAERTLATYEQMLNQSFEQRFAETRVATEHPTRGGHEEQPPADVQIDTVS
jgi:hypothetical protein